MNVTIKINARTTFPADGSISEILDSATISGSPSDIAAYRDRFNKAMTPADERTLDGWIAELDAITVRRDGGEVANHVLLQAYRKRLAQYPADVVHHALLTKLWKFFPTWAELSEECDSLVKKRMLISAAFDRPALPKPAADKPLSAEERGKVRDRVEELRKSFHATVTAEKSTDEARSRVDAARNEYLEREKRLAADRAKRGMADPEDDNETPQEAQA